ncbi:U32 family peptidase [Alkalibacter mobilis]|uniref:U32 family peptidase n=1 Tax=Alkalibacter mobilis TaxID=2787712 RepID=UPI00189E068E|nr:U32 family peptidase [Alkalibacter mobilis]MBF7095784.1 U32 family peptidase [Alkalibacter mobilis]
MKKPEILAPAGTLDALKAAVYAGADGVYIGAKEFNARQRGQNFDENEIRESVKLCHMFGVKLYVAINIALKDNEIKGAIDLAGFLYNENVDGLIVQDLGLFKLLKKNYPDFKIHSSTQMFIHELEGVKLLEEMGFFRIVLARELTLEEIKYIKENSKAEIKIFSHGAICISYSGQCYMSSMIGNRSGNRGRCAQPCRKEYKLLNLQGKELAKGRLISPMDLNTLEIIDRIIDTGIDSIKIEGRLKNPDYVHTVVKAYRQAVHESGEVTPKSINYDVNDVFNRKYTTGYLLNESPESEKLIEGSKTDEKFIKAGIINKVNGYNYGFKSLVDLSQGDGVFIKSKGENFGETLSSLFDKNFKPAGKISKGDYSYINLRKPVFEGDVIYKTHDVRTRQKISDDMNLAKAQKNHVKMKACFHVGDKPEIEMIFNNIDIKIQGEEPVQIARKAPLTAERIKEQLIKMKDTFFEVSELEIQVDENIFMAVSSLNELRRKAVAELESAVLRQYQRPKIEIAPVLPHKQESLKRKIVKDRILSVRVTDLENMKRVAKTKADEIVFGWDEPLNVEVFKRASAMAKDVGKSILFSFSRVIRKSESENIKRNLDNIMKLDFDGFLAGSFEAIRLLQNTGKPLDGDDNLNIFNSYSMAAFKELGIGNVYLSPELNFDEICELESDPDLDVSLVVHGRKDLMILQYDLEESVSAGKRFYLEDGMGFKFPVKKDGFGRTHIFNSKELCLLDEIKNLAMLKKLRIDNLWENEKPEELIQLYKYAIDVLRSNYDDYIERHRDGFTKGHFRRGVL